MPSSKATAASEFAGEENHNRTLVSTILTEKNRCSASKAYPLQPLQNIPKTTVQTITKLISSPKMGMGNKDDALVDAVTVKAPPPQDAPAYGKVEERKRNHSSENKVEVENYDSSNVIKKLKETATAPEVVNGLLDNDQGRSDKIKECVLAAEMQEQSPVRAVINDGERPSTSRAAMEVLVEAASHKDLLNADVAHATISSADAELDATNDSVSTGRNSFQNNNSGSESTSLSAKESNQQMPLPDKLLLVISNLYLNATNRLKLDFPPRCAFDLEHCHQLHYRGSLPPAPNHTQANNLRCALQQQRYVSFINWSYDMCHRNEYPGDGIFTKIIELVLSLNCKCFNRDSVSYFLNKFIELFSFIVRKFPPCWLTLRQFYINFFDSPLDAKKISAQNAQPFKSNSIFEILLELIENTMELCSSEDFQSMNDDLTLDSEITKTPKASTDISRLNNTMEMITSPTNLNNESSQASEFVNLWEWEAQENRLQTFEALTSARTRLKRLYISLQLLLQILENDFVMWILHHHKKPKDWIFNAEDRPLVVHVFALSKYTRCTRTVKELFKLFSISTSKCAKRHHLDILERLISLVMEVSNIADLEHTAMGLRYPNLGAETKSLIHEFFKTFKLYNTSQVSNYMRAIHLLRIPYVRYEFIDCFLQLLHLSHSQPMSPKKITTDIFKKRWLHYQPQAEISEINDKDLTREQYLALLLLALQAYCDWHGTKEFFCLLTKNAELNTFKAVGSSVHRSPAKSSDSLILQRMNNDIKELEERLRMTVIMSRPKLDLPLVDICIDGEMLQKYRTDLKYVINLYELVKEKEPQPKEAGISSTEVDFTAWRTYLADFATG